MRILPQHRHLLYTVLIRHCALPPQVVSWAKQQFLQEVGKPDGAIGLAKTCLVMALEEEAVGQLHLVGRQPRCVSPGACAALPYFKIAQSYMLKIPGPIG